MKSDLINFSFTLDRPEVESCDIFLLRLHDMVNMEFNRFVLLIQMFYSWVEVLRFDPPPPPIILNQFDTSQYC